MKYLIDTNVLCRLVRADDPQHTAARKAIDGLLEQGVELYITQQIEREFFSVATRPRENNGFGLSPNEALTYLSAFEKFASVLLDTPGVHEHWKVLVHKHHSVDSPTSAVAAKMLHHTATTCRNRFHERKIDRFEPEERACRSAPARDKPTIRINGSFAVPRKGPGWQR